MGECEERISDSVVLEHLPSAKPPGSVKSRRVAGRIAPAEPVDSAVPTTDNTRLASAEGYPSGQRGQTVNLLAMPS